MRMTLRTAIGGKVGCRTVDLDHAQPHRALARGLAAGHRLGDKEVSEVDEDREEPGRTAGEALAPRSLVTKMPATAASEQAATRVSGMATRLSRICATSRLPRPATLYPSVTLSDVLTLIVSSWLEFTESSSHARRRAAPIVARR